jgi:hypothetical protein
MDFEIGSNFYRNAEPSIEIDGMTQFSFDNNRRYNETMLKGMVFDQHGTLVARISENTLSFNLRGEYEIASDASFVKVLHRQKQEVLLEVKLLEKERVQIVKARLFTGRGKPFEVTPAMWRMADNTHTGETVDCAGGPVKLS